MASETREIGAQEFIEQVDQVDEEKIEERSLESLFKDFFVGEDDHENGSDIDLSTNDSNPNALGEIQTTTFDGNSVDLKDESSDLNNAVLEDIEAKKKKERDLGELNSLTTKLQGDQTLNSLDVVPQKETDNNEEEKKLPGGHYEKKNGIPVLWGAAACLAITTFPIGGGFAFLLVPAQFSSFALLGSWKKTKRKVWIVDKDQIPTDKIITEQSIDQNELSKMLEDTEKGNKQGVKQVSLEEATRTILENATPEQKQELEKIFEKLNQTTFERLGSAGDKGQGTGVKKERNPLETLSQMGGVSKTTPTTITTKPEESIGNSR